MTALLPSSSARRRPRVSTSGWPRYGLRTRHRPLERDRACFAARDVQAEEGHATVGPAHVLRIISALAGEGNRLPAERLVAYEEDLAQPLEPLKGVVAGAVAIGPLIVAGDIDERVEGVLESFLLAKEDFVGAR